MRSTFLFLITLSFSWIQLGWAGDVVRTPEEEKELKYWNDKITECRKYDYLCGGVADRMETLSDGTSVLIYKKPKPEIMQIFTALKKYVWKYADQMGVDPRAIVAGILAENSINTDFTNNAKNFLTRHSIFSAIAGNGKILGSYRSVGWGLIHCDTAYSAEEYVARAQNRQPINMADLCKLLTSEDHPEGAIYAAAVIARQAQDAYKNEGFDIGNKPDLMATLYNLGQPARRAADAKATNRAPRPNWFGVFIQRYIPQIEQAIGYSDYLASKNPASGNPASANKPSENAPRVATSNQKTLTADLKLWDSPGSCVQRSAQNAIVQANKGAQFDTVASSIDCDGSPWDLLETRDGIRGWIKRKIWSQSYEMKPAGTPCAPDFKGSQCIADLKDKTKDRDADLKGFNYQLNFYESGVSCKTPNRSVSSSQAQMETMSPQDAARLAALMEPYKSQYGGNPAVQAILTPERASDIYKMLRVCSKAPCKGPSTLLTKILSTPADKGVSSKDVVAINEMPDIQLQDEKGIRQRLLKAISPCQTLSGRLSDGKNSAEFIQAIVKDISTQPIWSSLFSTCTEFYDLLGERCSKLIPLSGAPGVSNGKNLPSKSSKACDPSQSITPLTEKDISNLESLLSQVKQRDLDSTYGAVYSDLNQSTPRGYLLSLNLKSPPAACISSGTLATFDARPPQEGKKGQDKEIKAEHSRFTADALAQFKKSNTKDADLSNLLMGSFRALPYAPSKYVGAFKAKQNSGNSSSSSQSASNQSNSNQSNSNQSSASASGNPLDAIGAGADSKQAENSCAENSQDTLDLITEVLQLPCVNQVYISNFYLYDLAKSNGINAVYRPMKETDKMPKLMFDLKMSEGKCGP